MEGIMFSVFFSVGFISVANGKIYTPCELVRAIENEKNSDSDRLDFDYEKHIPLVICIAGYRKYDTSYILKYPNGTGRGYHGIFGIHDSDAPRCYKPGDARGSQPPIDQLRNEVLGGDLRCLAHVILASKATVDYYEKLCSPPFVREVPCPLNNYAVTTVFDPIKKDVLERAFLTNRDPLALLKAEFLTTLPPPPETTDNQIETTSQTPSTPPKEILRSPHIVFPDSQSSQLRNSSSDDSHWTQKFTAFTCVIVLLAIVLIGASKTIQFVGKQRARRNLSQRNFHYDAESEMMQ